MMQKTRCVVNTGRYCRARNQQLRSLLDALDRGAPLAWPADTREVFILRSDSIGIKNLEKQRRIAWKLELHGVESRPKGLYREGKKNAVKDISTVYYIHMGSRGVFMLRS